MKFEIKSKWTGNLLFSIETETFKLAIEAAVKEGADLKGADLEGANLEGAYLKGAYLKGADLKGADLKGANLEGAYLKGAYLEGAYLKGANLKGANLEGADLEGAYLEGAYLEGAYLEGAYLKGANLEPTRRDVWAVLSSAPSEVEYLREALVAGKVDGSTYKRDVDGKPCGCLVGTMNIGAKMNGRTARVPQDSNRPAERFFLAIKFGDTPDTSVPAKIALGWIDEWLANVKAAFLGR